jgi:hypothetical protein
VLAVVYVLHNIMELLLERSFDKNQKASPKELVKI